MIKIIALITLMVSLFSINSISVFAESLMPITKYDIDSTITNLRKSFYSETYKMCRKDAYVSGDEKLIKAAFWEKIKSIMTMNNDWITTITKTRKLTTTELSEINYVKKTLQLELNDPKRPSWTVCDIIANDFQSHIEANTEGYLNTLDTLSNEYKTAVLTIVKWDLSKFTSTTMSGEVAVVKDKKIKKYVKELNTYSAIIIERTNVSWSIIWHYVFIPHFDINNKNATLTWDKLSVLTTDLMFRIYNGLREWNPYTMATKLYVKKIGSLYYGYKFYK